MPLLGFFPPTMEEMPDSQDSLAAEATEGLVHNVHNQTARTRARKRGHQAAAAASGGADEEGGTC